MLLAGLLVATLWTTPAEDFRQALERGGAISIVVLGDSIGDGMHLPDPDTESYAAVLVALLGQRFPTATIELDNQSVMAISTTNVLASFDTNVAPREPNLVVIQLGGNDKGTGDGIENLPQYRANLAELIHKSQALGALPAIVAPPMHEPVTGMPYPAAAMEVARAEGVPAVDADGAIKALGADYRGLFAYFIHPREREHTAIALALDQAIAAAAGYAAPCTVEIAEQVGEAGLGERVQAAVVIHNPSDQDVTVRLASQQLSFEIPAIQVPANDKRAVAGTFALPLTLPGGRSAEWPILVSIEADGRLAFDQKRLAIAPILMVPKSGSRAINTVWTHLGEASRVVVGRGRHGGERDFSAAVSGSVDDQNLKVTISVRDSDIVHGGPPLSDGIELYLDLRSDWDRGRAYYTPEVALLLIPPRPTETLLLLAEDRPAPELTTFPTSWETDRGGYRVTVTMPRATLDQVAGRRVTELGFDVAVDDDDGQGRKSQLLWLGRPDNFVNPRCFGQFRLDGDDANGRLRMTIFP